MAVVKSYSTTHPYKTIASPPVDGEVLPAFPGAKRGTTAEGAAAILVTNDTGAASVKGTIVDASASVAKGCSIAGTDSVDPIGAIYQSGVANGDKVWVATDGMVQVLLEDATAATMNYWCRTSITQAGRADCTNAAPPTAGINEAVDHFSELGHGFQTIGAGTDVIAWIDMHLN